MVVALLLYTAYDVRLTDCDSLVLMLRITLCSFVAAIAAGTSLFPVDSLLRSENIYEFGGDIPDPRVHHSMVASDDHVVLFGGYKSDGTVVNGNLLLLVRLFYLIFM